MEGKYISTAMLKIPYPKRLGFISLNTKRKVYFSFDNLSLFLLREENKIITPDDFVKWQESHTSYDVFVHATYYAAKSYAIQNRKKFDLKIGKFALGLAQCKSDDLVKLTEVWKRSQEFGADSIGKKKVAGS